jgi:hypothetical protein
VANATRRALCDKKPGASRAFHATSWSEAGKLRYLAAKGSPKRRRGRCAFESQGLIVKDVTAMILLVFYLATPFVVGHLHFVPENIRSPYVNRYFDYIDYRYEGSRAGWITSKLARRLIFTMRYATVFLGISGALLTGGLDAALTSVRDAVLASWR